MKSILRNFWTSIIFTPVCLFFQKRGYIPPESEETMILKEEDVEKPSQNIAKVIDTALDKGLDTKNVSSFWLVLKRHWNNDWIE